MPEYVNGSADAGDAVTPTVRRDPMSAATAATTARNEPPEFRA
jgi:hypothetical protein